MPRPHQDPPAAPPVSSLPSARARVLAFAAIIAAGVCGAIIGMSLVSVSCTGTCNAASVVGALIGASIAAGGVAVVAVLTLRAMGEWNRLSDAQLEGLDAGQRNGASEDPQPRG